MNLHEYCIVHHHWIHALITVSAIHSSFKFVELPTTILFHHSARCQTEAAGLSLWPSARYQRGRPSVLRPPRTVIDGIRPGSLMAELQSRAPSRGGGGGRRQGPHPTRRVQAQADHRRVVMLCSTAHRRREREREREREIFIYITLCHSEADVRDWRRSAYTRLN